jgi:hypothetical protein
MGLLLLGVISMAVFYPPIRRRRRKRAQSSCDFRSIEGSGSQAASPWPTTKVAKIFHFIDAFIGFLS